MKKFARIQYQPCKPLGDDGRCVTGCLEHIALSRRAAGEGMVLLKNHNAVLPFTKGSKIALFGHGSVNYVKGGLGSGDVYCAYTRNICDGLRDKAQLFDPLEQFYKTYVETQKKELKTIWDTEFPKVVAIKDGIEQETEIGKFHREHVVKEIPVPDELMEQAAAFTDTAVVVITRHSGEGWERIPEKGDYYLSDEEMDLVQTVKTRFAKCVIVLNVGGMMDTGWFANDPDIQGVLMGWQAGMEGGNAVGDILMGDVNPSGKLTDTFTDSFDAYPSSAGFNQSNEFVNYEEDIFVGYRYFDTIPGQKDHVIYPFGYGLSYTSFLLSEPSAREEEDTVTVQVSVTNTGKVAGKEVVQVYASAPQGLLGKPAKVLCGFAKTQLLQPGEAQKVTVTFPLSLMASFDDMGAIQKSAYVLEQGVYRLHIGTSSANTTTMDWAHTEDTNRVVEQLTQRCVPVALPRRLLADGSYQALPQGEAHHHFEPNVLPHALPPETVTGLTQVGETITMDEFIAQFTDEELCAFMGGSDCTGVCNTACFAGLKRLEIPGVPTADGPAGLRLNDECGIPTTAWPCATLLACTWNTSLVEEVGIAGGKEVKENNLAIWLTPALNIHRNPLCGRNFEYYSEDPVVSGKMAAAMVRGMQSQNIGCSVKHFACNNKEFRRTHSDSRVSERALREIYLKGFEICVKESDPWSVMTSYNLLNGIHTSESYDLITGILRGEWGFQGMVTTDWGHKCNPVYEVKAGNDMKMPIGYPEDLMAAMKTGELTRADLAACVKRMLTVYLRLD